MSQASSLKGNFGIRRLSANIPCGLDKEYLIGLQGWTVQLMVKRSGLAVDDFQEDAQDFKPARWLESSGQPLKSNPKGFMPFGGVSTEL